MRPPTYKKADCVHQTFAQPLADLPALAHPALLLRSWAAPFSRAFPKWY